jgi:hypothetical protein
LSTGGDGGGACAAGAGPPAIGIAVDSDWVGRAATYIDRVNKAKDKGSECEEDLPSTVGAKIRSDTLPEPRLGPLASSWAQSCPS